VGTRDQRLGTRDQRLGTGDWDLADEIATPRVVGARNDKVGAVRLCDGVRFRRNSGGHRANQAYDEKSSILGKQLHIPDDCVMSARSCVAPPGQWRFDDEMSEHSGRSRHSSRAVREPLRPHGAGRPWMKVSENT
jgi:hypothetical protein